MVSSLLPHQTMEPTVKGPIQRLGGESLVSMPRMGLGLLPRSIRRRTIATNSTNAKTSRFWELISPQNSAQTKKFIYPAHPSPRQLPRVLPRTYWNLLSSMWRWTVTKKTLCNPILECKGFFGSFQRLQESTISSVHGDTRIVSQLVMLNGSAYFCEKWYQ